MWSTAGPKVFIIYSRSNQQDGLSDIDFILEYFIAFGHYRMTSKQMDDEKKEMLETIEKLQIENQRLLEELKMNKSNENEENEKETNKNCKGRYLSLPSFASIILYIGTTNRFLLSLYYKKFRNFEKTVPLHLKDFCITEWAMVFDEQTLKFEKRNIHRFHHSPPFAVIPGKVPKGSEVVDILRKVVFDLFSGRRNLRIQAFYTDIDFPFELKLDIGLINMRPFFKSDFYCYLIRNLDVLAIQDLPSPDSLKHSWVQNVRQLENTLQYHTHFLAELPNLRAESIYINFQKSTEHYEAIIRTWCDSRNGRIGSKMFLTFDKSFEETIFNELFLRNGYKELGFELVSEGILRLPMENNSEARLTIRNDKENFRSIYLKRSSFSRYLYLEIVNWKNRTFL